MDKSDLDLLDITLPGRRKGILHAIQQLGE